MAKETKGAAEQTAAPAGTFKYVGPLPAARIGNLPGITGTKPADQLTQDQIAYVIATAAAPLSEKVAKWWTSE